MKITKKIKIESIRENYKKHNIYTIQDIKNNDKSYFFSPSTMRFFKSKVINEVFCSKKLCYFVTSESKSFYDLTRAFTVRSFNPKTKEIRTISDPFTETSRTVALNTALNLAFNNGEV